LEEISMKIGMKIRELRQQAGVSQEVLAQALGVTPQAVSRWENGITAPDISLLPSLASYFDVSIDALFAYDDANREQEMEQFFDRYYALLPQAPEEAQALLEQALKRYPGQEALRLLQCFHLKTPEDFPAKIRLCMALSQSQNPTVRTEAIIVLANTYHKLGDEARMRDMLALLPECDSTKLSLSAQFLSGEEAMLCAQRQKHCSLAQLFEMMLRIAALYQEAGQEPQAEQTRRTAQGLLDALREDAPYRFPKGNSASTWERFSAEYGPLLSLT
jgi:transcriptional regulator with XRE-family HTH domain